MASNTTFLILVVLAANVLVSFYLGYELYDVKKTLSQGERPEIQESLSESSKNIRKRNVDFTDFEEVRINSEFTKYVKSLWNKGNISFNPGNDSVAKPVIHLERNARTDKGNLCHYEKKNDITNLEPVTVDGNKLLEFDGKNKTVKVKIPGYYYIYSQVEYQLLTKTQKREIRNIYKNKTRNITDNFYADGHVVCRNQKVLLESYYKPFEIGTKLKYTQSTTLTDFNGGIFKFEIDDRLWIRNLGYISPSDHQIYFGAFYFDFPHQALIESKTPSPPSTSSSPSTPSTPSPPSAPSCNLEEESLFITKNWTDGIHFCFSLYPVAHCPHTCHAEKEISTVDFNCLLSNDENAVKLQESYKKEKIINFPRGIGIPIYEEVEKPIACRHNNFTVFKPDQGGWNWNDSILAKIYRFLSY